MTGYIKLYREQLQTEILKNPQVLLVWVFLNEQVRFRQAVQNGIEVLPGQVLLTAVYIAQKCNLTVRQVRYCLKRFEQEGLIRMQNIRNRYTLITVLTPNEGEAVQGSAAASEPIAEPEPMPTAAIEPTKSTPSEATIGVSEPTAAEPVPTAAEPVPTAAEPEPTENAADGAKKESVSQTPENGAKRRYGLCNNVYLTDEEKRLLCTRSADYELYIDNLSAYKRRTHKSYDDDFSVLCEWMCKDAIRERQTAAQQPARPTRPEREQTAAQRVPPTAKTASADGASYDLEEAERIARERVPVLRKRPPRSF